LRSATLACVHQASFESIVVFTTIDDFTAPPGTTDEAEILAASL
jgi:hypothetical protein